MTDIQRWARAYGHGGPQPQPDGMIPNEVGIWVTYADHVAAVQQAERRSVGELLLSSTPPISDETWQQSAYDTGYEQGQRDERESIVASLRDGSARLEGRRVGFIDDALAAAVQRVEALDIYPYEQVIAAIKGEQG